MRRYITKLATVLWPPLLYHYHSYHDWHDLEPTARSDSWRSPECNTTVIFINVINVIKIITIITTVVFILIINFTRQKPAYGQKGLAGGSLRASGAQLGSGKWWFFVTDTQTDTSSYREAHNEKKTFSFGHCPNHLHPPLPDPNSGNLVLFFRKSKFKIWKSV